MNRKLLLKSGSHWGKIPPMTKSHIRLFAAVSAAVALAHAPASAVRLDAPAPEYADGEVSVWTPLPLAGASTRTLEIRLSFESTPTNNVEAVFGRGFGAGDFSCPDGTAAAVGWDGGWFLAGDRLRQPFPAGAAGQPDGPRTLLIRMRIAPSGEPLSVAFEADGAPLAFAGLDPEALLRWLAPGRWDSLQLTARNNGGGGPASLEARVIGDGTLLMVR